MATVAIRPSTGNRMSLMCCRFLSYTLQPVMHVVVPNITAGRTS